ncbi:hypothetical protein ACFVT5_12935 [Streptomyces sp. NPDC058001]|uniref:hypothetical protein n=1 Tax=Streptomyces sp. NPDC058001 TaxID=3346300 RepID=UPI0036E87A11
MTISRDTDIPVPMTGGLGRRLQRWATGTRDQAAVTALVQERSLLAREDVRLALVREDGAGGVLCDWAGLARHLYILELDAGERVFLGFVLSMAGPHQTALSRVQELDEARLAIVLRALIRLSGNLRIAVGTRA